MMADDVLFISRQMLRFYSTQFDDLAGTTSGKDVDVFFIFTLEQIVF